MNEEELKKLIIDYKKKLSANDVKAQKLDDNVKNLEDKLKNIKARKKALLAAHNKQFRKARDHYLIVFAIWVINLFPQLSAYQKSATKPEEIHALITQIYWILRHAIEQKRAIGDVKNIQFDSRYIDIVISNEIKKRHVNKAKMDKAKEPSGVSKTTVTAGTVRTTMTPGTTQTVGMTGAPGTHKTNGTANSYKSINH